MTEPAFSSRHSDSTTKTIARIAIPWLLFAFAAGLALSQMNRPERLPTLWPRWAEVGVLATGMTAILLTGGVDLSVGSIVALAGMVLGVAWRDHGWSIWAAAVLAIGAGAAAGAVNGTLVALGVAPLAATLATMALYSGLATALASGERVAGLPADFASLGQGSIAGLPNQVWLLAAATAVVGTIVHKTRFGRRLYAIGDNRLAARFAGVPVRGDEWKLYCLSGVLAGLVAVATTARSGAAVPDAGSGMELLAISCVVLGGTRVTGGFGGVGRTLLGLGVLAHLDIGLQLLGSRRIWLPWREAPWQLDAQGRLVVVGLLVVLMAAVNERLGATSSRRD